MKQTILMMLFVVIGNSIFTQNKTAADDLVMEGIELHDKGDYKGAISKYDKALSLDNDNLFALTEKAYSLLSLGKNKESIENCEKAIKLYPDDKDLNVVYVTYGNATDGLKNTEKAIKIYDQGLAKFPDFYQLHFNKGVSLSGLKLYGEALISFEKTVIYNPNHASSHNAIGRLKNYDGKRIPALLAFCRFLALEPQSVRAEENLAAVGVIISGNVEKTGKQSVTININASILGDTTATGDPNENSFSMVDMLLSMSSALDYDKKYKNDTDVEKFIRKFDSFCSTLKEGQEKNYGFYWEYYVPYFTAMQEKGYVEVFSYIAFASSGDSDVSKWLKSHTGEMEEFYNWSAGFKWKSE